MSSTDSNQIGNPIQVDSELDSSFFTSISLNPMANVGIKLPCKRDDIQYKINKHNIVGRCIILNYQTFDKKLGMTERKGSEKDVKSLISTFSNLRFQVESYDDQTYNDTISIIQKESKSRNHSDCFVMCILSHGENGVFYCKDKFLETDRVINYFAGNNCPALVGKPKLFFIQACQGNVFDDGTLVYDSYTKLNTISIPNYADILIFLSTYPGHYSFRNVDRGSWFIQSLCQKLDSNYKNYDLMTILTMVSQYVAYNHESCSNQPAQNKKKQMPCIVSTLTRLLYL